MSFMIMVLPPRGGATIKARCPRPSGVIKSTARPVSERVTLFSNTIRWLGKRGVRLSNGFGSTQRSTGIPSTAST